MSHRLLATEVCDIWDESVRLLDLAAQEGGASTLPGIESALEALEAQGRTDQMFWLLPALARALALSGQLDRAEEAGADAYAYFRQVGSARGQAMALIAGATVAFAKGRYEAALAHATKAANLAALVTDPALHVRVASARGALLIEVGRIAESIEALELGLQAAHDALEEPASLRLRAYLALAIATQAVQARDKGQFNEVWRRRAERAVELIRPVLSEQLALARQEQFAGLYGILALANLALDHLPDAHKALDSAMDALPVSNTRARSSVMLPAFRARAHLQAADLSSALLSIDEALRACDPLQPSPGHDEIYRLKSLIHERLGQIEEAFAAYKQFHQLHEQFVFDRVKRIDSESRHDALTGLANRRHFDEHLARALRRATPEQPVSLMFIDLDHFKSVNDRHSHMAGDAALRWVSMHLQAACRQTDFAARLGGDEFALVLAAPMDVAMQVFARVRCAVADRCQELPPEVRITLSAGIAQARGHCKLSELIALADQALYAAKAAGRDGVQASAASLE